MSNPTGVLALQIPMESGFSEGLRAHTGFAIAHERTASTASPGASHKVLPGTDFLGRTNQRYINRRAVCLQCINFVVQVGQITVLLHVAQIFLATVLGICMVHSCNMQAN